MFQKLKIIHLIPYFKGLFVTRVSSNAESTDKKDGGEKKNRKRLSDQFRQRRGEPSATHLPFEQIGDGDAPHLSMYSKLRRRPGTAGLTPLGANKSGGAATKLHLMSLAC